MRKFVNVEHMTTQMTKPTGPTGPTGTMRLALFDIDGTLLRPGNRVHSQSMIEAAAEVTGHDIRAQFPRLLDSGGRTDKYIVSELLRLCEMSADAIEEAFPKIAELAVAKTGTGLAEPVAGWALEGAAAFIAACESANVAIGLVTGNLPEIARIKLSAAGLWEPFGRQNPLIAGFGDRSEDRNDLSAAALRMAQDQYPDLDPADVWIVGDTPRDVECAVAIGAKCLGVTTGHYSAQDLMAAECDVIVKSLVDVDPLDLL